MTMENYFRNLKSVLEFGAACSSLPLLLSFASLQPPWPPAIGPLAGALVFVASLIAWEWVPYGSLKNRRRLIVVGIVVSVTALLIYLYLYSKFVDAIPGTSFRVVRGYVCTDKAALVYRSACPNLPSDALQHAELDPTELWTRDSITNVRLGLCGMWLLFTFGLVLFAGSVVAGRKL